MPMFVIALCGLAGVASAKTNTTTTLAASPSPAFVSQSVTLTATITGTSPTGTVTFKDGATTLGTGTISAGKATLATSFAATGAHSLTAAYTIRAIGGGRYKLTGTLEAKLTQSCIITLEPMETEAKIPVAVEFSPNADQPPQASAEGEDFEVLAPP